MLMSLYCVMSSGDSTFGIRTIAVPFHPSAITFRFIASRTNSGHNLLQRTREGFYTRATPGHTPHVPTHSSV